MWPLDGRYTGSAASLAFDGIGSARAFQAALFLGTNNFYTAAG
jgi:hypothetical protein